MSRSAASHPGSRCWFSTAGPGWNHTWFGDYLDPLTETGRYRLVLAASSSITSRMTQVRTRSAGPGLR